ncbi:hypothetical protein QBC32DRAFT_346534 [Pseudoneurospora amorphoporcata]|uniref:Uncharacterized protein n=1 Tax=Pseudoneurospora amorphoporcata TaxID=241081 RepID=A0AAN6NR02_9PEZI|nr:hypothetical protein QBC32DRAFT_346534 [Pseudoneurospora amorphoporcata]
MAAKDNEPPPECKELCETAYIDAQRVGKTSSLCEAGSSFREHYNECDVCLRHSTQIEYGAVVKEYLEPRFAQFIGYCDEQNVPAGVDPSWYASTTTLAVATLTISNIRTTVTVVKDTSVLRSDWTGFPANAPSSTSTAATTTTGSSPTSQQTTAAPPGTATNGPSSWVWAIVGVVIALVLIGLGIVAFLYKRGKFRFIKKKLGLESAQELDGDTAWRTGDKPELHGESRAVAASTGPPKELDSSEKPIEMSAKGLSTRLVELPTEFNESRAPPDPRENKDGREGSEHC